MKKMVLTLGIAFLALSGCKEITIKDGRVPAEYLAQAKAMEGTYYGSFDGKRAQIKIRFEGDLAVLDYSDSYGTDPIDPNCHSKIDLLKKVVLHKKDGQEVLDQASFTFNPGTCRQVRGRTLDIDFDGPNKFEASIYDYSDYIQRCTPGGAPPPYGPGTNCQTQEVPHYLTGKFFR